MSKIVYTGLESSGKSLILADVAIRLLKRNKKWSKQHGFERLLYSNLKFSEAVELAFPNQIKYWADIRELRGLTGVDVIWDEISTDLSAMKKAPLTRALNRWLRQGAKQGVEIYATAQEFHDIHLDFRRRVHIAYQMTKVIGSPRGGDKMPRVGLIWGLCLKRELNIHPYNELEPGYVGIFPSAFLIRKSKTEVFDTHQTIMSSAELPYEHIEYVCERPTCKDLPKHMRIQHR